MLPSNVKLLSKIEKKEDIEVEYEFEILPKKTASLSAGETGSCAPLMTSVGTVIFSGLICVH